MRTKSLTTGQKMFNPRDAKQMIAKRDYVMRRLFDSITTATKPDIIADVGSFDGEETIRFRNLAPEARCYAFEANYQNINSYFTDREELRGVEVIHKAVADYDGSIDFHILQDDEEEVDWRRMAGSLQERTDGLQSKKIAVDCVKLDTFFQNDLDKTFVLWIDVEGALHKVINGAGKVLERTIAVRAEVERHTYWEGQKLAGEIVAHFNKLGFVLLGDTYFPGIIGEQSDVVFLNRNWLNLAMNRFVYGGDEW